MKRFIGLLVALMLVFSLIPCMASATGDAIAADGWSVANDNYLGWSMEDGVITGDFNIGWENAEPISLWKDVLTNESDFTLELDMTANNATSPFIALLGVRIEADGNNGDGNQVFLKTNNTEAFEGPNRDHDWLKAAGCKVHITVWRIAGGDLTIRITGESSDSVIGETKTLTMTPAATGAKVEIGVYRGCAQFAGLTLSDGVSEIPGEPVVTQPTEPEPTETNPVETQPKPTQPKPTEPKPNDPAPADDGTGLWIAIAVAAAVVIVVAVVLIIKKKKA